MLPVSHRYPAVEIDDFTVIGSPSSGDRTLAMQLVRRLRDQQSAFRVKMGKGMKARIEPLDLSNMLSSKLDRRDLPAAQKPQ